MCILLTLVRSPCEHPAGGGADGRQQSLLQSGQVPRRHHHVFPSSAWNSQSHEMVAQQENCIFGATGCKFLNDLVFMLTKIVSIDTTVFFLRFVIIWSFRNDCCQIIQRGRTLQNKMATPRYAGCGVFSCLWHWCRCWAGPVSSHPISVPPPPEGVCHRPLWSTEQSSQSLPPHSPPYSAHACTHLHKSGLGRGCCCFFMQMQLKEIVRVDSAVCRTISCFQFQFRIFVFFSVESLF